MRTPVQLGILQQAPGGQSGYIGGTNTARPYDSAMTTVSDLGTFMEAVYNFAKQDPAHGQRLIDDLANAIFPSGLPGELPLDLLVAHKEGAVSGLDNDTGIVCQ